MASENFERAKQDYYDRIGYGEKSSVKGTPIIFIIVGVIFLIIGIVGANSSNNFMKNAKPVEAIMYSERDTYSSSDEDEYKAYAEYTVDGVNYYEYLSGFSHTGASKSKEGEKTTIYYNPENPKEIGVPSSKILFYIFIFMGAIVTLAGIYAIFRKNNVDNSTAPEKVADFWEKVDETTGFFDKSAAVETTVLNLKNIVGIVICACVILFGLIIQISDLSFSSKSKEITGTISKIDSYVDRDADNHQYTKTDIYVQYEVDGKEYEEIIDISGENHTEGEKVTIYYNVDNPKEIKTTNKIKFTGIIIIVVGVFFLLACFIFRK